MNREPNPTMKVALSDSELEVLQLIATGCKNREIALVLEIQEVTVRFHVGNILSKLNARNRTQAACFALRNGLIKTSV